MTVEVDTLFNSRPGFRSPGSWRLRGERGRERGLTKPVDESLVPALSTTFLGWESCSDPGLRCLLSDEMLSRIFRRHASMG